MIVEEIMQTNVITMTKDETIEKALQLINEHRIRHIPIVDDSLRVIGIISDRDIRDACPSIFDKGEDCSTFEKPISTIMVTEIITGHPLDFVEEVSALFYEHEISCLPITRAGKLVGILTETDVLHTFVQMTGANQPGSQLEVEVPNRAGCLSDVAQIIGRHKCNISSVLIYPSKKEGRKILVFRVQTINPTKIINEINDEGFHVLWPNLPGITP